MSEIPAKLNELLEDMDAVTDRMERAELLIEIADRFPAVRVPAEIAAKPYDEAHRVPACESEAFVWAVDQPNGTLKYYFDVLNPQGLSAMAIAVILDRLASSSGKPGTLATCCPTPTIRRCRRSSTACGTWGWSTCCDWSMATCRCSVCCC
ncbi:MAG: SufE family protein [Blastochloris sp.]|nr:SufE family protein [Blastochloris sp.]